MSICEYGERMRVDGREIDRRLVGCAARRAALDVEEARWLRAADEEAVYLEMGWPTMIA
jgi:hypothetical protein